MSYQTKKHMFVDERNYDIGREVSGIPIPDPYEIKSISYTCVNNCSSKREYKYIRVYYQVTEDKNDYGEIIFYNEK